MSLNHPSMIGIFSEWFTLITNNNWFDDATTSARFFLFFQKFPQMNFYCLEKKFEFSIIEKQRRTYHTGQYVAVYLSVCGLHSSWNTKKKKTERISCRCEKSVDGRYPSPPGDCAVTTFLVYYLKRKFFFVKKSSKIEASKMFKLKTTECKFPSKSKTKQWKKKKKKKCVAENWARAPLFLLSR